MKTLKIKLSRWLNGSNLDGRGFFLYREEDKKMCCLGFYMRKEGYKISDIVTPSHLINYIKVPKWLLERHDYDSRDDRDQLGLPNNSEECSLLMSINDATHYNPNKTLDNERSFICEDKGELGPRWKRLPMSKRKALVRKIFARNDVNVEFVP